MSLNTGLKPTIMRVNSPCKLTVRLAYEYIHFVLLWIIKAFKCVNTVCELWRYTAIVLLENNTQLYSF